MSSDAQDMALCACADTQCGSVDAGFGADHTSTHENGFVLFFLEHSTCTCNFLDLDAALSVLMIQHDAQYRPASAKPH